MNADDQQIAEMILAKIESMPEDEKRSNDPIIYIAVVDELLFDKHIALYFSSEPPAKLSPLVAINRLEVAVVLREPEIVMTPQEFVHDLMLRVLPELNFFFGEIRS